MRLTLALLLVACAAVQAGGLPHAGGLPKKLSDTGYGRPGLLSFSPQYPLWSDGTTKQRWIMLPPGTSIDATDPEAWEFPAGTRLFKDFSLGRRIETRVIERRADGGWEFGVYVWDEEERQAWLAPARGIAALPVAGAPGGRYTIPSRSDCQACHEGARVPVLGFSALQLSPERDPLAPHADARSQVDLHELVRMGKLHGLPQQLLESPPRIAARTPVERAALGYLHANCGHCHAAATGTDAAVPVDLRLAQDLGGPASSAAVLASLLDAPSRFRGSSDGADVIATPGRPDAGVLLERMRSRDPRTQMPPLGTAKPDAEGLALIQDWLESLPAAHTRD